MKPIKGKEKETRKFRLILKITLHLGLLSEDIGLNPNDSNVMLS